MDRDEESPRCVVCRTARTGDAYELEESEIEVLASARGVRAAAWLHRKYGALPICRPCFDGLGFGLENERPEERTGLVAIRRREKRSDSTTDNR
jgi:hypothetical protein